MELGLEPKTRQKQRWPGSGLLTMSGHEFVASAVESRVKPKIHHVEGLTHILNMSRLQFVEILLVISNSNLYSRDNSFSLTTLMSSTSSITVPNSSECE
ncbi:hypothetical protein TNCV_4777191 [Trichonephila clavipes]|nr:hypothetical protein TNCV_4777191 [Trichonephila clavipes]